MSKQMNWDEVNTQKKMKRKRINKGNGNKSARTITARYAGTCAICHKPFKKGTLTRYTGEAIYHAQCPGEERIPRKQLPPKVTREDAKTVSCPRCAVLENEDCIGAKGQMRESCHAERFKKFSKRGLRGISLDIADRQPLRTSNGL